MARLRNPFSRPNFEISPIWHPLISSEMS